jgi:hypothetical protein
MNWLSPVAATPAEGRHRRVRAAGMALRKLTKMNAPRPVHNDRYVEVRMIDMLKSAGRTG